MAVKVLQQDYHRNGVGGAGFVVSLVEWPDPISERNDLTDPRFVAVSFFKPEYADCPTPTPGEKREYMREHTAVLNIEALAAGCIDMFDTQHPNAWRGADYVGPSVVEAWQERCRAGIAHGPVKSIGYDPFDSDWEEPKS